MSWFILLPLAVAFLLSLFLLGARVFVAFLTLNIVGLLVLVGPRGFGLFTNSIYETATSPSLITVALFVLMGEILFRSGSVDLLFNSVDRLVGEVRGRLYIVVMLLATIFGALSGSAVAVAAMLGGSLLPMMRDRGYDAGLSTGTILAGASLAPIIPPSLLAIIVGSLADVSIAGLLVAGIVPGLMFAGLTLAYVLITAKDLPMAQVERKGSAWKALGGMLPFLLVVFSVMGLGGCYAFGKCSDRCCRCDDRFRNLWETEVAYDARCPQLGGQSQRRVADHRGFSQAVCSASFPFGCNTRAGCFFDRS